MSTFERWQRNYDRDRMAAMSHLRTALAKASSEPVTSYAPIARALLVLDEPEGARMRRKFDVCYLMAKKGIAFEKFPSLCETRSRSG